MYTIFSTVSIIFKNMLSPFLANTSIIVPSFSTHISLQPFNFGELLPQFLLDFWLPWHCASFMQITTAARNWCLQSHIYVQKSVIYSFFFFHPPVPLFFPITVLTYSLNFEWWGGVYKEDWSAAEPLKLGWLRVSVLTITTV